MKDFCMEEKRAGGYSLLEILMAVTILAIIVTPLLSMFIYSLDHSRRAWLETQAAACAQDMMEQLKAEGYGSLRHKLSGGSYQSPEESFEEEGEVFTRCYSLQLVSREISGGEDPLEVEVLQVEVRVEWNEGEKETVLTSYLAPW